MLNTSLTIFLADDDAEDRMLVQQAFEALGLLIDLKEFDNGVSLMDSLLNKEIPLPNAIYLDLNMPLMNGEECLTDIRYEPGLSNIPIIIYSSYLDGMKADLLKQKGANLYLVKPTSFEKLKIALMKSVAYLRMPDSKEREAIDFVIQY
tara:strand:- start:127 stop:573 length:447 start_codon:yes stop_codon:yes gene_type:complete